MTQAGSRLDALLPRYDFTEGHARVIRREPRAVYEAFKALTLRELPVSGLLFAVRSLPARLAGSAGLPSPSAVPLLEQFLDLGFVLLVDVPGEELAAGVIGQMWRRGGRTVIPSGREEFVAFAEPGFVKAALTFCFIGQGDGTTLVETETRVAATDPTARRGSAKVPTRWCGTSPRPVPCALRAWPERQKWGDPAAGHGDSLAPGWGFHQHGLRA